MARTKAVLGDARRDERAEWMFDRIVATGSLELREIGSTRSGEIAAHRLLSSEDIDPAKLLVPHVGRTVAACRGRRVVAAQDTSEINFDRMRRPAAGLGPTGNPGIRGFFVHPVVAVDAEDEALLGLAGAQIWTRGEEPTPMHHDIAYDEKESRRWLTAAEMAATHLAPVATQVVVVSDREGDIYPMFARRPETVDLVVRAAQDRVLTEGGNLFAAAAAWPALGGAQVKVRPKRPGDKGRTANVTIKAGTVTVKRPSSACNRREPRTLTLGLVEVREAAAPKGAGKPHPAGRCARRQREACHGRDRAGGDRSGSRNIGNARRRHAAPAKPAQERLARPAVMDRSAARRLELLLQAAGPQDDGSRPRPPPRPYRRLQACNGPIRCVNPVGCHGRGFFFSCACRRGCGRVAADLSGPRRDWRKRESAVSICVL